jgi:hypothetical protein
MRSMMPWRSHDEQVIKRKISNKKNDNIKLTGNKIIK